MADQKSGVSGLTSPNKIHNFTDNLTSDFESSDNSSDSTGY